MGVVLKYLVPICAFIVGSRILGVAFRIFSSNEDLRFLVLAGTPIEEILHASAGGAADTDRDCPFRNSSMYRSIYVYPTFNGSYGKDWTSDPMILSRYGKPNAVNGTNSPLKPWPWLRYDETERKRGIGKYDLSNLLMQSYSLELIVRDIITHTDSCLRTDDPDTAKLFYIPYLPSAEYHVEGMLSPRRGCEEAYGASPYAQAIIDAMDGKYHEWEKLFGLTSRYWKRRNGSDHILVHSEVMHGLRHHVRERGHYAYIYNQFQLKAPVSISTEVTKTFLDLHPKCAAKNILVPYPNPDGRWYNGKHARIAAAWRKSHNLTNPMDSNAALEAEAIIAREGQRSDEPRAVAFHYRAGSHGSCQQIRETLGTDLKCTNSSTFWNRTMSESLHGSILAGFQNIIIQMHSSTFSFAPVGDTPTAKRMFDITLAKSIPVVLSDEFIWPFSTEVDADEWSSWNPADFSIRLNVSDYLVPRYDLQCTKIHGTKPSVQEVLEELSPGDIRRLRRGVKAAALRYSFYSTARAGESANLLQERILPDGGAAHALVNALANRAEGVRWSDCEKELKMPPKGGDPKAFGCTSPVTTNLPLLEDQSRKYEMLCSRRQGRLKSNYVRVT